MVLFVSDSADMKYFWLHIAHCPRAMLGYLLMKKIPRSHDLANTLQLPPGEKLSIDTIIERIIEAAQISLTTFT